MEVVNNWVMVVDNSARAGALLGTVEATATPPLPKICGTCSAWIEGFCLFWHIPSESTAGCSAWKPEPEE